MKNTIRVFAILALLPMTTYAQTTLDKEVNAELDKMYQASGVATSNAPAQGTQVNVNVQAQPQAAAVNTTEATQAAALEANAQILKQPTTVIEAAPVTESRAEQIRKARQDAELATELKIVEKLEQSRMDDERRRAETLFGDKFNSLQAPKAEANTTATVTTQIQGDNATVTPVVVQEVKPEAAAVVAAPAPVVAEAPKAEPALDREAIRGEIKTALSEMNEVKAEEPKDETYAGVLLGAGEYPDVANIRTNGGIGVMIGKTFGGNLAVEGSFTYSLYEVEQRDGGVTTCCAYYPRMTEMAQYNTTGSVKYQFLSGKFRPSVGALATYAYRSYRDTQFGYPGTASSQAVDLGASVGADVKFDSKFSLGADFKYMFYNLWNRADNTLQESFVFGQDYADRRVETLSYWQLSVTGRMTF